RNQDVFGAIRPGPHRRDENVSATTPKPTQVGEFRRPQGAGCTIRPRRAWLRNDQVRLAVTHLNGLARAHGASNGARDRCFLQHSFGDPEPELTTISLSFNIKRRDLAVGKGVLRASGGGMPNDRCGLSTSGVDLYVGRSRLAQGGCRR